MIVNYTKFKHISLICGKTDMRKSINDRDQALADKYISTRAMVVIRGIIYIIAEGN